METPLDCSALDWSRQQMRQLNEDAAEFKWSNKIYKERRRYIELMTKHLMNKQLAASGVNYAHMSEDADDAGERAATTSVAQRPTSQRRVDWKPAKNKDGDIISTTADDYKTAALELLPQKQKNGYSQWKYDKASASGAYFRRYISVHLSKNKVKRARIIRKKGMRCHSLSAPPSHLCACLLHRCRQYLHGRVRAADGGAGGAGRGRRSNLH